MEPVDIATFVQLIAGMATVIGLVLVYWSIKAPIREEVFLAYTARYADLLQKLPKGFFGSPGQQDAESADIRQIQAYVDLCSEEVKLKLRRGVPERVWEDWGPAIRAGVECPNVLAALRGMTWGGEYHVLKAFVSDGLESARRIYKNPPPPNQKVNWNSVDIES
jgi:hypothetical protein